MGELYSENLGDISSISTAALIGAVSGQLFFGLTADFIGRKIGFIITLSMVTLFSLVSALVFNTKIVSIFIMLSVARFFLGFGIGGEYPLSATITSESSSSSTAAAAAAAANASSDAASSSGAGDAPSASLIDSARIVLSHQDPDDLQQELERKRKAAIIEEAKLNKYRGTKLAAVCSMQGIGALLAPTIIYLLLLIFPATGLDFVWRIALGLGALPGVFTMYFRLILEDTMTHKRSGLFAGLFFWRRKSSSASGNRSSGSGSSAANDNIAALHVPVRSSSRDLELKDQPSTPTRPRAGGEEADPAERRSRRTSLADDLELSATSSSSAGGRRSMSTAPVLADHQQQHSFSAKLTQLFQTPFWLKVLVAKFYIRFPRICMIRKYWVRLLGTAGCWFILDVTFYSNALFYPTVIEILNFGTRTANNLEDVRQNLITSSLISIIRKCSMGL